MIAISVTAIGLRLISRGLVQRGQRFWWDDWVALLSLVRGRSPILFSTSPGLFLSFPATAQARLET